MHAAEIRKRISDGFRPFIICPSDGRELKVPRPEFLAIRKCAIAVVDDEGHLNSIALLHVTSIKDLTGHGKRPKNAA